ncbi:MAG: hypothetical protein J5808_05895, partial [Paludibacteraceae bacterium]|nr:hypothetical protein [Paludibacteraceae bacterium]
MKKLNLSSFVAAMFLFAASSPSLFAQQLPNSGFEDWGGAAFNGNIQLTSWKASNVEQTYMGITARANMVTRSTDAHSGLYSACVKNTKVEVAGIGEVSPAWITLGTPFADISNDIAGATAGTYGGMNFTYRPDTMQVWIKRTGGTAENYNLVYYSWYGTTYNTQYDSKSKGCVTISQKTDEESDIRQQTDKNRCATPTGDGAQVGEGWVKEMKIYNSWTLIKVPINYYNDSKPTKVNVILSAGNYPNFRANNVLEGYTLYVDDLSLIYSSKIHKLLVNGRAISGFNPNVYNYTYELGVNATDDDVRNVAVTAYRSGRKLSGSEITMTSVNKLGDTMTITVKAEDGSSTTKYYVTFIKKKSTNSAPASIEVGGTSILGFNAYESDYTVEVPYGSTEMPEITITKGESKQTYEVTPCSIPGTAVVTVYAEDTSVKSVYNIHLVNAKLSDTTLEDILINGRSLPGFKPTRTTYNNVEIPIGSTSVAIGYESAYPAGEQTVVIDNQGVNATSTITVTAPGATSPRVYKITCNEAESSYAYLNDLKVGGVSVDGFDPETFSYTVNLPVGTTEIPAITWTAGDAYQTITLDQSGISGVDGTARVIVVAGNGVATQTYRLTFATLKSSVCTLNDILLDGVSLVGFDAETTNYTQNIASGAALPTVTYVKGDEWQSVSVLPSSSRIRLVVTAQDGSSKTYTIDFVSVVSDVTTLNDILLNGVSLAGFDANTLEYNIDLPRGTASLPTVTWVAGDAGQTIRYFASTSLNGQSRIQVKSQAGSVANYLLNFSVPVSSDANLTGISLDGVALEGFDAAQTDYAVVLPSGTVALPEITYIKNDEYQTVKVQTAGVKGTTTLTVTAEDGTKKIYSIAFSVEKSANAALTGIYLDGVLIDGFDPDVLDYTYALDASAVSCPVVTVGKTEGQTVSVIVPARLGTARITVTPEEGASNIYTVTFTEQLSTNSLLADLQVDGTSVLGFQPTIFGYAMELPQGTSTLPLIAYTKGDDKQQVYVQTNGLNGPTVLTVVAENGSQSVYTLQFAVEQSSSALLADILIDGVSLAGFDANTFVYNCTLVDGAACPTITYVKGEAGQVVELSQPALQGLATLHVTSEDGTAEAMYELSFAYATYTERYLTDLQVNGATVIGFDPETLSYDVTLPYGSAIPTIDYTTAAGQSMSMTNDKTGCTLRVTAGDGVVTIYTVNYIYSVSTQSALADLQIYNAETEQYVSLAGFAPEVLNYNQSLAWRSSRVPAINPVFMDDSQSAVIAYSGVSGTTTITVTAGDKVSQTVYTIAFEVAKSSDANLSAIMIGDEEIELQDGETDYVYELPYGTTALPMISYEKGVAADGSVIGEQTVSMTVAPIDKTSSIEVTAEDGSVQTYHLDFVVAAPQKSNTLQYIYCGSAFVAVQEDVYTYNLTFPYGTTVVPDVTYVKQYPEQTVDVVKGTMNQATTLTVHSNVVGVADVIYTLNISAVASPSYSLTGITGATLYPDFDPNVTHYVAMVTDPNQVVFSIDESVSRLEVTRTASVCTAEVFDKDDDFYTRTYTVSLHYPDVIPNGEMTDWTTAKYNKGAKPVSWTVPADVAESKFVGVWGMGVTYYSGQEIQKGDGFAKLSTRVSGKVLGGYFPGMMTLGNMSVSYGEANGTTSSVDGGIPFRNTPDLFSIRYAYPKKNDDRITNLHFKCTLTDGSATVFAEHTDNVVSSNYKVVNVPIEYNNGFAPTTMNILLNSSQTENASAMSDLGSSIGGWFSSGTNDEVAVANVDYVRFIYNSTLASMTVDGNAPTKTSGTNYAYTLDSEYIGLPALDFVGEVSDQGYGISWSDEVSGVRTATIISYAEDASTTTYVLTLNRPASDINTLNKLLVGGVALTGFDANVTEYSVQVPHGTRCLPDVQVEKGSYYQNVALARNGYDATITVIAENGAQKVYIIHFVESKSSNATLQSVSVDGFDINFDAAVNDYAIELEAHTTVLPAISFEKLSDGQTVVLVEGGVNGVTTLTVTAEDGTTTNVYSIASSVAGFDASEAVLADLSVVNGNVLNYQKETYRYTYNRPNGQVLYGAYAGLWSEDVMSAVVTADSLVVSLSNAASTQAHNYTLVFETVASTNALLADILINGVSYGEFNPNLGDYEYPLVAGQMLSVEPIAAEPAQTLSMTYDEATTTYTIDVTAEDGLTTKSYTIAVLADLSNNALLADLQLDGVTVAGFVADQFVYSVELPSVTPKMTQPSLPDLTAVGADRGQTIVVDYNGLDEVSYITVTAEDGVTENTYEITISAQKSSNALLDDLVADYVSLTDFAQDKFDYTLDVQGNYRPTISWQSGDAFQEITDDITADRVQLTVKAEDGTTNVYTIIFNATYSSDVTIEGILLDGTLIDGFDVNTLSYDVVLPFGTDVLPDITVVSGAEGQSVELTNNGLRGTSTIVITAEDGTTDKTYEIHFSVEASNIAWLQDINADGVWNTEFNPLVTDYHIDLPIGTVALPEVTYTKGDELQTV